MARQACADCGRPVYRFPSKGKKRRRRGWRGKKDHDLCRRCWNAEGDRLKVSAFRCSPAVVSGTP
jgi:hypothetical protein